MSSSSVRTFFNSDGPTTTPEPSNASHASTPSGPSTPSHANIDNGPVSRFPHRQYAITNERYRDLFTNADDWDCQTAGRGVGWLANGDLQNPCSVLIAQSLSSAICFIRETIGDGVLGSAYWEALRQAAVKLDEQIPRELAATVAKTLPISKTNAGAAEKRLIDNSARSRPGASGEDDASNKDENENGNESGRGDNEETGDLDVDGDGDLNGKTPPPTKKQPRYRITTGTSVNRRLIQKRLERKRLSLGLVPPPEAAPLAEHFAYDCLKPKDIATISWLFKQQRTSKDNEDSVTFLESASTPYATVSRWLEYAAGIGSPETLAQTWRFLDIWRRSGLPFPTGNAANGAVSFSVVCSSVSTNPNGALRKAWQGVLASEEQLAVTHIQYRWAMATLAGLYNRRVAELKAAENANAYRRLANRGSGRGRIQTRVIDDLIADVVLGSNLTPVQNTEQIRAVRLSFLKKLAYARRWLVLTEELGWLAICLLPHDGLSNHVVHQVFTGSDWRLWLEMVKRVRPDVVKACIGFENWLGEFDGLTATISSKEKLRLESGYSQPPRLRDVRSDSESDIDLDIEGDSQPSRLRIIDLIGTAEELYEGNLVELFTPIIPEDSGPRSSLEL